MNPTKAGWGVVVLAVGLAMTLAAIPAVPSWAQDVPVQVQGRESSECSRFALTPEQPRWISSAAWVEARAQLLVVDPRQDSLMLYNPAGQFVGTVDDPRIDASTPLRISAIEPAPGRGFLLKLVGSRMLWLNEDLTPESSRRGIDLQAKATVRERHIGSLYSNWVIHDRHLVAYGSVREPGGQGFALGFLAARLDGEPSSVRMLKPFAGNDYYSLGYRLVGANERGAFFLVMAERPEIVEVQFEGGYRLRTLRAFPAEFRNVPTLRTENLGPASTEPLFGELEGLSVPLGLFGQGRFVYVLTRKPADGGGTHWQLHQIDTDTDELTGAVRLPTTASHLTVVPTEGTWYLFERGRVGGGGRQEIGSLVAIPTAWITAPGSSPLQLPAPAVTTCRMAR